MSDNLNINPKASYTDSLGQNAENNKRKDGFKKYLSVAWEFFKIIIVAAIIVLPIRYFLFQPFIVKGESMLPYLKSGDYLVVDEISYRFTTPQRGDIVVLDYPLDTTQRFIKRVIGLPGETVDIKNGKVVIIKGQESMVLAESYLPQDLETDGTIRIELKDNEYFVMGDNRQFSYDSRRWGILPKEDIIGKAAIRVFPISSMTLILHSKY